MRDNQEHETVAEVERRNVRESAAEVEAEDREWSNTVRLSPREWIIAAALIAVVFVFTPIVWKRVEPLNPTSGHRMPYSLSNDYWTYDRWAREACSEERIPVIGDSVIWGHYVRPGETLPHYLNESSDEKRFANLGVDGIHPAALAGLIEYYGRGISGRKVILHCNLLWMSSPRHDLQIEKEFALNHPKLVPQFVPDIPCYREPVSGRLAIVVGRHVPFSGWADHMRLACFEGTDIPRWTVKQPYRNPVRAVTLELPAPDEPPSPVPDARPWNAKGISPFGPPWVDLETSIQWRSFRHTVEILERRGNAVFVVVGPFNEHLLTPESRETYQRMKRAVGTWLEEHEIQHRIPDALPSDEFADASHPLAEGYARLAGQLLENGPFVRFVSDAPSHSGPGGGSE